MQPKDPNTVSSSELIEMIRDDVYTGHGFVPLVGSGLSAPSGILMGMQFSNFLAYTVWRVIESKNGRPWNLRKDGWPRYPKDSDLDEVRKWTFDNFKRICLDHEFDIEPNDSQTEVLEVKFRDSKNTPTAVADAINRPLIPEIIKASDADTWEKENTAIKLQRQFRGDAYFSSAGFGEGKSRTSKSFGVESAIRSMHDWRATLRFLASCEIENDRVFVKETVSSAVIDSFNVHIARGKQVNLGQKMLAHLARPMRIRTILTTNFDRLIETAFRKLLIPLNVVSVSIKGEMPNPLSVRSQNTLVKLHGETIETRADFTLDDDPRETDKRAFAEYVRGDFDDAATTSAVPNHIIVVGFSGSDMRIIQMLKHLLDFHKDVKIYWICYGDSEPLRISRLFGVDYEQNLVFHHTIRPDLLLYELYQQLNLCLPSGGFSYEFTHKVPPESTEAFYNSDEDIERQLNDVSPVFAEGLDADGRITDKRRARRILAKEVGLHIADVVSGRETISDESHFFPKRKPLAVVCWDKSKAEEACYADLYISSGGTGTLREAYSLLSSRRFHCVWLELQDYPDAYTLFQDILRILSLKVGFFQLEHFVLNPLPDDKFDSKSLHLHMERLVDVLGLSDKKWTVFLQGRDVPGSCAGWLNASWGKTEYYKKNKNKLTLNEIILTLKKYGIHVIYAPLTKSRAKRDISKIGKKGVSISQAKATLEGFFDESSRKQSGNIKKDKVKGRRFKRALKQRRGVLKSPSKYDRKKSKDERGILLGRVEANTSLETSQYEIYEEIVSHIFSKWLRPSAEDANSGDAKYLERLKFLYATTLFRQSRHSSAFFTNAVYECPVRFNLSSIDNDLDRANVVRQWVVELKKLNVFLHKAGGYSWKYRDIRLGIQRALENLPMFQYWSRIHIPSGKGRVDFFLQMRARAHFSIGDWYAKAFMATGHHMPVVESLYHRFECLEFARFACPSSLQGQSERKLKALLRYRLILMRSAVIEMIKTLSIARPWLKFWLSDVSGRHLFKDTSPIENLKKRTSNWIDEEKNKWKGKENEEFRDQISSWGNKHEANCDALINELKSLQTSLIGESNMMNGHSIALPAMPDFSARVGEPLAIKFDACKKNHERFFLKKLKRLGATFVEDIVDLINRNEEKDEVFRGKLLDILRTKRAEWTCQALEEDDGDEVLFRVVCLVAEYAYQCVKRAKFEADVPAKNQGQSRATWLKATVLCFIGLDYCKHLHPGFLKQELKLKIKLNSIYGLALGHLGRPFEANRHLNEANAILSKSSRSLDEMEVAIIRLRRAEVYLVRVDNLALALEQISRNGLGKKGTKLVKQLLKETKNKEEIEKWNSEDKVDFFRTLLRKINEKAEWKKNYRFRFLDEGNDHSNLIYFDPLINHALRLSEDAKDGEQFVSKLVTHLNRLHSAMLDDAWVSLESASSLLSGFSHSSLWWGQVVALKLKAYGCIRKNSTFETLVFRRKLQHDEEVRGLFKRSLLLKPSNDYAHVNSIDITSRAMAALTKQSATALEPFSSNDWLQLYKVLASVSLDFKDGKTDSKKMFASVAKKLIKRSCVGNRGEIFRELQELNLVDAKLRFTKKFIKGNRELDRCLKRSFEPIQ